MDLNILVFGIQIYLIVSTIKVFYGHTNELHIILNNRKNFGSMYNTLMMEVASTSEISVNFYQTPWHNSPEDNHLHN
jgi:hypothetical protein